MSKLHSKAKEKVRFYCRPISSFVNDQPCYCDVPVGNDLLARKLKEMFISAGLDSDGISYHSLRATSVSRIYNEGIPEKLIMERTDHLSTAGVQSYERTTSLQQKGVPDTLSAVLSRLDNKEGILTSIQQTSSSLKKGESMEDKGKNNEVGKLF